MTVIQYRWFTIYLTDMRQGGGEIVSSELTLYVATGEERMLRHRRQSLITPGLLPVDGPVLNKQ